MRAAGIIFFFLTILPIQAMACSCRESTFEDSFKQARTVVSATVLKPAGDKKVVLQLDDVWKGKAPESIIAELKTGLSASCAATGTLQPPAGSRYVLYLGDISQRKEMVTRIGACSRNGPLHEHEEDVIGAKTYQRALAKLDEEVKIQQRSKEAFLKRALFLKEWGDVPQAIEAFTTLTTDFSDYAEAWSAFAALTFEQTDEIWRYESDKEKLEPLRREFEKALSYVERALSLKKEDEQAQKLKATLLIKLGRTENLAMSGADLSGNTFQQRDFNGQTLVNTSFADAQFNQVAFSDAKLENVSFEKANFSGGRFVRSSLHSVRMDEARFSSAYMPREKLMLDGGGIVDSQIKDSSFKKTVLFEASIVNTAIENSNFEEASLYNGEGDKEVVLIERVKAKDTNFKKIRISGNSFMIGTIRDSQFQRCDFSEARIAANIINTDFSTSNLDTANFTGSNIDCKTKWPQNFNPAAHGMVIPKECRPKNYTAPNFEGWTLERYSRFGPVNLEGANFKNADLGGAFFIGANLQGADFTGAILGNVDFRNANLQGAKFNNTNFSGNFEGADLKGTNFAGADISGARFGKDDKLGEADFTLARIRQDSLEKLPKSFDPDKHMFVYWANGVCDESISRVIEQEEKDLTGINLAYACLTGANFKNTKLDKATLYNADLTNAVLDGASFIGTKYSCDTVVPEKYQSILQTMVLIEQSGACRSGLKIPVPNLAGADLSGMNLWYAYLKDADLRNADLRKTNLVSANLQGANLTGAKLHGATYDSGTKWPDGFDYVTAGAVAGGTRGGEIQ